MLRRLLCCAKEVGVRSDDAVATFSRAGRYAMADGASTSYAGGAWARILSRRFVKAPSIDLAWLSEARATFLDRVCLRSSDWLGELARNRGSHSTLLGFDFKPDSVRGFAVGDTVLFVITSQGWHHYPPLAVEDFWADPVLLASHPGAGALPDTDEALAAHAFQIPIDPATAPVIRLLVMTDALAAWILADNVEQRLESLGSFAANDSLRTLVNAEVAAGRMRHDDATLLILEP